MTTETRKRKEQRTFQQKRQRQLYILIGIVVAAVLVLAIAIISTQRLTQTAEAVAQIAEGEAYEGVAVSLNEEGMPQLGSEDAPLTIYDYSSYGCGHCMTFHQQQLPRLMDYIRDGQVRFVVVPVTNQFSAPASVGAFCALEQGKFWEMQDILFGYLAQYGANAYTRARLDEAAAALNLDTEAFNECLLSDEASVQIEAANDLFFALAEQNPNVTGTPTITYNGVAPEWGSGAPQWEYTVAKIAEFTN
ncbi:MAG: thioredoxin domain-containing protein [Anaerolineae bacterium]|nr:thioredoxin domain-containing protein [Anaerolineae bacterium]